MRLKELPLLVFVWLLAVTVVTAQPSGGNARPLTLAEAMRQARSDNAALSAAVQRVAGDSARIPQSLAWMAPMVGVNAMNIPITTTNILEAGMGVRFMASQTIPWPGKRQPGVEAAREAVASSRAAVEAQRRAQDVQVVQAYARLVNIERTRQAYVRQKELVDRIEDLTTRRYATGSSTQQDVLRVGLESSQFLIRLAGLESDRGGTLATLKLLTGDVTADSLVPVTGQEELIRLLENASGGAEARLVKDGSPAALLQERPELGQLEARQRAVGARLEATRKSLLPDVTVSAEYAWMPDQTMAEEDPMPDGDPMDPVAPAPIDAMAATDTWSVGVSVTLPWAPWARRGNQAEMEAWLAEERALERDREALSQSILAQVTTARAAVMSARNTLRLYQDEIVPQAQASYQSALNAYEKGAGDLTGLLEAWRALVDVDLARTNVTDSYIQALAAFAGAVGTDLSQSIVTP